MNPYDLFRASQKVLHPFSGEEVMPFCDVESYQVPPKPSIEVESWRVVERQPDLRLIHSGAKVNVMRKAVLMEDEGHEALIAYQIPMENAVSWISMQGDEYFKPSDYYITESAYKGWRDPSSNYKLPEWGGWKEER